MKWSSPLPPLEFHWYRKYTPWGWGFYSSRYSPNGDGLQLLLYLGPWELNLYITWPERSRS